MNKNIFRSASLAAAVALVAALPSAARAQQFQQYVALGDSLTAGWQSGCLVQRNQLTNYPSQLASSLFDGDFELPLVQEGPLTGSGAPACLGAIFVPPASLSVAPMSEMAGPLNATAAAALQRPRHSGSGGRRPDDADARRRERHGPREALGADPAQRHRLALRRHERRQPGGSPPRPRGQRRDRDPVDRQQQRPRRLDLGHRRGRHHADFPGGLPDVLLGDHRGHPAGRGARRGQHPRRDLDPVLDDDPAGPGQPRDAPAGHHQRVRRCPCSGRATAAYPCTPVPPDQGCGLPPGSLVNLPASSLLGQGVGIPVAAGGTGIPLPHGSIDQTGAHPGVVLYPDDIALLQQRTSEYNSVIASSSGDAVLVDTNARFTEIKQHGYSIGGITLTTSFLTGGIFSYDGVHPSTIGYTIVAERVHQRHQRPDLLELPAAGLRERALHAQPSGSGYGRQPPGRRPLELHVRHVEERPRLDRLVPRHAGGHAGRPDCAGAPDRPDHTGGGPADPHGRKAPGRVGNSTLPHCQAPGAAPPGLCLLARFC